MLKWEIWSRILKGELSLILQAVDGIWLHDVNFEKGATVVFVRTMVADTCFWLPWRLQVPKIVGVTTPMTYFGMWKVGAAAWKTD